MKNEIELWKSIKNFELYDVSTFGRIRSWNKGNGRGKSLTFKIMKIAESNKFGHSFICLRKKGIKKLASIHRLVLETFVEACPKNMECRHIDGNPRNNYISNLKWGTKKENAQDRFKHGTVCCGSRNGNSKLTEVQVKQIRKLHTYRQGKVLARKFNVSKTTIYNIIKHKQWRNLK